MRSRAHHILLTLLLTLALLPWHGRAIQAGPPLPAVTPPGDHQAIDRVGDAWPLALRAPSKPAPLSDPTSAPALEAPELAAQPPDAPAAAALAPDAILGAGLASGYGNLAPYTPPATSYPATPASVMGTRTTNALYAGLPTYFDWAVVNSGDAPILAGFETRLYLDGLLIGSWRVEGLQPRWYAYVADFAYTVTTPGWHRLRLLVDARQEAVEADEQDNYWEYSFYWQPIGQPNLRAVVPPGWPAALVLSATAGTRASDTLWAGQPTYFDWAIINDGPVSVMASFQTTLYLDDQRIASWQTGSLLPRWLAKTEDWSHAVMSPGWHTVRLVIDSGGAVDEANEADNVWEGRFYWQASGKPNLRPYRPEGWSGSLVVSSAAGTNTSTTLYAGQPLYLDWAVINDSVVAIAGTFYHHLYIDGQRVASWYSSRVSGRWYMTCVDWTYTIAQPGWHRFVLVTDATGAVAESDERDNVCQVDLWLEEREVRTVGVEWVNSYLRSGLSYLQHNESNVTRLVDELARIGWSTAFNWGEESAWERDFKDVARGGADNQVVDSVALAYFSGHGNRDGLLFDTQRDDYHLRHDEAAWGDGGLNWLVADACLVLNNDDGQCIQRWAPAFRGLHMLLGFDTVCYDTPSRGENLARYADGSYWWQGALPIKEAWFQAAAVTESSASYSAALIATQPNIDPSGDYLPGIGSYSPDPVAPTQFFLWRVQN